MFFEEHILFFVPPPALKDEGVEVIIPSLPTLLACSFFLLSRQGLESELFGIFSPILGSEGLNNFSKEVVFLSSQKGYFWGPVLPIHLKSSIIYLLWPKKEYQKSSKTDPWTMALFEILNPCQCNLNLDLMGGGSKFFIFVDSSCIILIKLKVSLCLSSDPHSAAFTLSVKDSLMSAFLRGGKRNSLFCKRLRSKKLLYSAK